jgi:hypothetical protein
VFSLAVVNVVSIVAADELDEIRGGGRRYPRTEKEKLTAQAVGRERWT